MLELKLNVVVKGATDVFTTIQSLLQSAVIRQIHEIMIREHFSPHTFSALKKLSLIHKHKNRLITLCCI